MVPARGLLPHKTPFHGTPIIVAAIVSVTIFTAGLLSTSANPEGPSLRDLASKVWIDSSSEPQGSVSNPSPPLDESILPLSPPPSAPPPLTPESSTQTSLCAHCPVFSEVTFRGALNNTGLYTRQRYRFTNVYLRNNDTMDVYFPHSMPLPVINHTVHTVHINSVEPVLPTTARYHKARFPREAVDINFNYTHVGPEGAQTECTRWEERPVYLVQVPHDGNVWHVWHDALMGAFQTLREEGLLPIAQIDAQGNMEEYIDDLEEDCPWGIDVGGDGQPYRLPECRPKKGLVEQTQCSPGEDSWCRPGLVAVNRTRGPILLLAQKTERPTNKSVAMFHAVSNDIREWDSMVGTCFRELLIGKTNTLNFDVNIFPNRPNAKYNKDHRYKAMWAFHKLMMAAEVERRAVRNKLNPDRPTWSGYGNNGLERLRQGVGPEEIEALDVLRQLRRKAMALEKWGEDITKEMQKRLDEEEGNMRVRVAAKARKASNELENGVTDEAWPDAPRPVVTFMRRSGLRRSVLNEADILEYILSRYNVTVRVTSFEEPLVEIIHLMDSTDVLLGMHGAGWTNALFLKPGAAVIQFFPYGWKMERNRQIIRGLGYKNIARAKRCIYAEWINGYPEYAFMRPWDFESMKRRHKAPPYPFSLHPQPEWDLPDNPKTAGSHWIYQNTLVNMRNFTAKFDLTMMTKGIKPMPLH